MSRIADFAGGRAVGQATDAGAGVAAEGVGAPALIVVGAVVALRVEPLALARAEAPA